MKKVMIQKEFHQGFFIVWTALSISAVLILLAPYVLPEGTIYHLSSLCEDSLFGKGECPLCGMTTAFIEIAKGHFSLAFESNRAALTLYLLLIINQLFFLRNILSKRSPLRNFSFSWHKEKISLPQ